MSDVNGYLALRVRDQVLVTNYQRGPLGVGIYFEGSYYSVPIGEAKQVVNLDDVEF
jgi:hypothetical protein